MPTSDLLHSPASRGLQGAAFAQSAPFDEHVDDDSPDIHRNAPRPDPICLYGLVGDVARAGSEGTEANPYAIAANFMAYLSCAIGRGPYLPVGNTWHHARLFILHIGRSGRGRKGDAVYAVY
jgi:putative DNA primase/helicase